MDKQLKDFSDLELADIVGQLYNELMQVQLNLQGVNQELNRRKGRVGSKIAQPTPPPILPTIEEAKK